MSVKTASRPLESPAVAPPLGAHHDGGGASFALFSSVADGVELCLFDDSGAETRWSLAAGRRVRVAGLPAGRAAGPALRISCARAVGSVVGRRAVTRRSCCSTRMPARSRVRCAGIRRSTVTRPMTRISRTAATRRRTCRARSWSAADFDWGADRRPGRAMADSIFYEVHVKGFTDAAPRCAREAARHLRRDGASGRRRSTCSGSA